MEPTREQWYRRRIAEREAQVRQRGKRFAALERQVAHAPRLPAVEAGGLLGPRLTAIVAYLKGACHASCSIIRRCVRDVLGLPLSRGYLAKIIRKASAALQDTYAALLRRQTADAGPGVHERDLLRAADGLSVGRPGCDGHLPALDSPRPLSGMGAGGPVLATVERGPDGVR